MTCVLECFTSIHLKQGHHAVTLHKKARYIGCRCICCLTGGLVGKEREFSTFRTVHMCKSPTVCACQLATHARELTKATRQSCCKSVTQGVCDIEISADHQVNACVAKKPRPYSGLSGPPRLSAPLQHKPYRRLHRPAVRSQALPKAT